MGSRRNIDPSHLVWRGGGIAGRGGCGGGRGGRGGLVRLVLGLSGGGRRRQPKSKNGQGRQTAASRQERAIVLHHGLGRLDFEREGNFGFTPRCDPPCDALHRLGYRGVLLSALR